MNQELASRFVLDADTTLAYAAGDSPGYVACAALDERNLAPTLPGAEKRWGPGGFSERGARRRGQPGRQLQRRGAGPGDCSERVERPSDLIPVYRRAIYATEEGRAALVEVLIKPMCTPELPDDWSVYCQRGASHENHHHRPQQAPQGRAPHRAQPLAP